jgi:very-short-patch-repair endonuclease
MSYRNKYKKPYEQPQASPIEISFWETAKPLIPELQREAWIDKKYRVDFLVPSRNVIIELYGFQYHNTKYKITKDAERERYLQGKGYQCSGPRNLDRILMIFRG